MGEETASNTTPSEAASLDELEKMNLGELKNAARKLGIAEDVIQKADDQDDENEYLLNLITPLVQTSPKATHNVIDDIDDDEDQLMLGTKEEMQPLLKDEDSKDQ